MGYYSDVAVTLTGEVQELKDLLNAYRLTETTEQVTQAWHLLMEGNKNDYAGNVSFFYEEFNDPQPPQVAQMIWIFHGVKWYDESTKALKRLGEMIETMQEENDSYASLALYTERIGEQSDDYDEEYWGENVWDYDQPVELVRKFEVALKATEVNPIKQLFNNEGK